MSHDIVIMVSYFHRLCCLSSLLEGSLESSRRLYPVLAGLQCIAVLDQVADCKR